MKLLRHLILCLLILCTGLRSIADDIIFYEGIEFKRQEIPFYVFAEYTPQLALRMGYAKAEVSNPEDWHALSSEHVAYEIDLVFTKYPKDLHAWRTDYYDLLTERLHTLFEIDSTFKDVDIRWNMILQTQCTTEDLAMQYFHGFVIKYRPKEVRVIDEIESIAELREVVTGYAITTDSTVIRVMERNAKWDNILVVMDWTASMYDFGAQLLLWHKLNIGTSKEKVKHFVFFNDGNRKRPREKKIGKTGGIYHCKSNEMPVVLRMMEKVMKNGNGGEVPENDLEAVRKGISLLEGYDEVILIADNKSGVRDMPLLKNLNVPIRVILCDVRNDYINPDYIRIAFHTGGSLHTIDRDIDRLAQLQKGEIVHIGDATYIMKDGEISRVR